MLQGRALLGALLLGLLSGCFGDGAERSASWLKRFKQPFQGVTGPNAVYVDVAIVRLPVADTVRYRDLWTFIDEGEQVVPLEKKSLLEANGFRVGHGGAEPSGELLALLTERRNRTEARRIQIVAGQEERCLDMGPKLDALSFELVGNGVPTCVALEQAQCCLSFAPALTDDGRIRLKVTPKVRYQSQEKAPWRPRDDRTGWMRASQTTLDEYLNDVIELTVSPGEYLVLGPRLDRPESLGCRNFVRAEETPPHFRVLVVRCWRPEGGETPTPTGKEGPTPLAAQASRKVWDESVP